MENNDHNKGDTLGIGVSLFGPHKIRSTPFVDKYKANVHKDVVLTGRFRTRNKGHMDYFCGSIEQLTAVEPYKGNAEPESKSNVKDGKYSY